MGDLVSRARAAMNGLLLLSLVLSWLVYSRGENFEDTLAKVFSTTEPTGRYASSYHDVIESGFRIGSWISSLEEDGPFDLEEERRAEGADLVNRLRIVEELLDVLSYEQLVASDEKLEAVYARQLFFKAPSTLNVPIDDFINPPYFDDDFDSPEDYDFWDEVGRRHSEMLQFERLVALAIGPNSKFIQKFLDENKNATLLDLKKAMESGIKFPYLEVYVNTSTAAELGLGFWLVFLFFINSVSRTMKVVAGKSKSISGLDWVFFHRGGGFGIGVIWLLAPGALIPILSARQGLTSIEYHIAFGIVVGWVLSIALLLKLFEIRQTFLKRLRNEGLIDRE